MDSVNKGAFHAEPDTMRILVLGAAPAKDRPAIAALFALDDRFAQVLRTTREPMIGQIRLRWWHDALDALAADAVPAEPVLQEIARHVLVRGVATGDLAAMADGWEALLSESLDDAALHAHAEERGARLFGIAASLLGVDRERAMTAGRGWALYDLAGHLSDGKDAKRAATLAGVFLEDAFSRHWARSGRVLGVAALLERFAAEPGSPMKQFARITRFRLTGW